MLIRSRLERRYTELVPRHLRELAKANGLPAPNRYVPAAEAEPILYEEDVDSYADSESYYIALPDGGNGVHAGHSETPSERPA